MSKFYEVVEVFLNLNFIRKAVGTIFSFSRLFAVFALFLFSISLVNAQVSFLAIDANFSPSNGSIGEPFLMLFQAIDASGNSVGFNGNCNGAGSTNLTANATGLFNYPSPGNPSVNESVTSNPGVAITNWDSVNGNGTAILAATQGGSYNLSIFTVCSVSENTNSTAINISGAAAPSLGNLTGYVNDSSNSTFIVGANVSFSGAENKWNLTDSNGHYVIYDVTAGSGYSVWVNASDQGYSPGVHSGNITIVADTDNEYNYSIAFNFGATGNVTGYVWNETIGVPLVGANVSYFGVENKSILSDSSGYYEFNDLTPGQAFGISANVTGENFSPVNGTNMSVNVGADESREYNWTMTNLGNGSGPGSGAGNITGYVFNGSDGSPFVNARVDFVGPVNYTTNTNESGQYEFINLTNGSGFGLMAVFEAYVTNSSNTTTVVDNASTEYNFTLYPGGGASPGEPGEPMPQGSAFCDGGENGSATIHGQVLNGSGDGLVNATIRMGPRFEGPMAPGEMPMGGCFAYTQTNASGDYHVTGFLSGVYDVFLEPPLNSDYSNAKDTANLTTNSTNASINFTLGTGGKIIVNVSAGGNPVQNVNVFSFVPFIPTGPGDQPPEEQSGSFAFSMTNASGEARLAGLTNGTYSVRVEPFGTSFASTEVHGIVVAENTTYLNVTLSTAGSISGWVNASNGTPIANAHINAFVPFGPGMEGGPGGFGFAMTNGSGFYNLTGLPNGTYEMEVNPPFDSEYSRVFRRGVNVTEGNTNSQNFTLKTGSVLTGTVTESDGSTPVANAFVDAFIPSPTPFSPPVAFGFGSTNSTGGYRITGLQAGKYEVRVNPPFNSAYSSASAQGVVITEGATSTKDFNLSAGGSLSGVVTGSGGVSYAFVNAFIPSTDPHTPPSAFGWAQTNSSGHYNMTGLQPGSYEVFVEPPFGSAYTTGHGQANITEGQESSLNFSLGSGGSISGTVVDADNNSVSGAFIDAFSHNAHSFGFSGTKSDGTFTISGLAEATDYVLFVHPPAGQTKGKTSVAGLSVTAGSTTDAGTISLVSASGGIEGNVTYSNGTGVSTARVFAWSPSSFSFGDSAVNDSGYFNITGLSAGTYDMFVDFGLSGIPNQFAPNLTVSTSTIQQDFTLNTAGLIRINGTVNTSTENVDVGVFNESTHTGSFNKTNGSGYYEMTVPSGTYHLHAFHPDYLPVYVETVDITSNTTYNIDLTALSSLTTFTLNGTVTVDGTATSGLTVVIADTGNSTNSLTQITGATGNYTITGVLPSSYNVTAISGANTNSSLVNVTDANTTQNIAIYTS